MYYFLFVLINTCCIPLRNFLDYKLYGGMSLCNAGDYCSATPASAYDFIYT